MYGACHSHLSAASQWYASSARGLYLPAGLSAAAARCHPLQVYMVYANSRDEVAYTWYEVNKRLGDARPAAAKVPFNPAQETVVDLRYKVGLGKWYAKHLDSQVLAQRLPREWPNNEHHWRFGCDALGGIRHRHASTIEKYASLPELMAAVYDSSPVLDVLEFVFEAT
jgi:hypothetical protein